MTYIKIAKDHEVLNKYKKLRKFCDNYIILESEKVLLHAHRLGFKFEEIISTKQFFDKYPNLFSQNKYSIEKKELSSFIGYASHTGTFGLIRIPESIQSYSERVIILDGLTSPENVGSICRSASAFGFKTVIYDNRGVSPYMRRCIRVSTGHILGLNIIKTNSLKNEIDKLKSDGFKILCAHNTENSVELHSVQKSNKMAIIIGSEGHGISPEIVELCSEEIKITTDLAVDHLNVSNAASIIMHFYKKI